MMVLCKGYGGDTMRANDEAIFWMRNDDWFRVDDERDCLELRGDKVGCRAAGV